ncbi:MAG: LCP family protein [Clostridia bacterium]|nr:LCP family protein [Clostridia bacterium]
MKKVKKEKTQMNEEEIKENKPKKRFIVLKVLLVIILIIGLAIGGFLAYSTMKNGWGLSGMLATVMGHDEETLKNLDEFRVLVLGVSTDTSAVLTDTIIVASYDPKTQTANLLSIPRDTFVGKSEKNATSYNKINAVYQNDPDKILKTVNEITNLNLKYYVVVETEALIKLVDVIGGVTFDVPIDMDYDDSSQDLHIHLKAGEQLLDGEKAENLVRFRHNNNGTSYPMEYGDNDIGRMRTQREFIMQVAKQTIKLKNITKIGEIVDVAYKYVKTNIPSEVVKDYIPYIVNFNTENIETGTLPGAPEKINNLWFYKYNKKQTSELIEEMFEKNKDDDFSQEEQEDKQSETQTSSQTNTQNKSQTQQSSNTSNQNITVEIINASGEKSKLTKMQTALKNKGYKISKTSETKETKNTVIINNNKLEQSSVDQIKELLNINISSTSTSTSSTTSKGNADITIIIGKDYN